MEITFLGATGTVTGSKYLLEHNQKKILVDCGLFQGEKSLRLRNWQAPPVDPSEIDIIIITHAHIDHTGYLPVFVKHGFQGKIYATEATYDLCSILLPDSGHIQEEDARRANEYGYTQHNPALPLYTQKEAEATLNYFEIVEFGKVYQFFKQIHVTWHHAGHILGAACVEFDVGGMNLVFTGDLGRLNDPVMKPPDWIKKADYLVIESTYGDRLHDNIDPIDFLKDVINKTIRRGGTVIIPAFAVGRSQSILYYLSQLRLSHQIDPVPIYLDSPMAINATQLMYKYHNEHKLDHDQCQLACNVATYVGTAEESFELDQDERPKIIVSASGMMTGGRVLHHLKAYASDSRHTILMTGYQARGTRGARLLSGERLLKIFGTSVPVRADVEYLTNTSAHVDYGEMLEWLRHFDYAPRKVFITHGEAASAAHLKSLIEDKLSWQCVIPDYLDSDQLF